MNSILPFLKKLEKNNNRDWFNANKSEYLQAKEEFELFVEAMIADLQVFDSNMAGATAKNCVFRIYRDTRFSSDKTPYKTHMGAYMIGGGRKSALPGYYVHIQPGGSFIAGGMWKPGPDQLKAIRKEIANFPEDIVEILEDKKFASDYTMYSEDKLSRPPQGFSTDTEQIELIKNRHFIASLNFPDEWIESADFKSRLIKACKGLLPFNQFLYRAISV